MTVRALSSTSVELPTGGLWVLAVAVTDSDGCPATVTPTVTVTLPDGTTTSPALEEVTSGVWRAEYVPAVAGRFIARVAATGLGVADFACQVTAPVPASGMPDADDLDEYLGPHSFADEILDDVLAAEAAAQRKMCRVPAVYPADLREALLRRCARNLAMRRVPLSVLQGDADAGTTNAYPGRDPEVRRLEAPWRKLVVA